MRALVILCLAFAGAPFLLTGSYVLGILLLAMLTVVTAVGLDLVVGYAGQYSFAQGAFTGLGAYTAAILERDWGASFWLQLPAGIMVAGCSGFLLGTPALRLRGHFLAIVTIAFQTIVVLVLAQWTSFTGGPYGLTLNDIPGFAGTKQLYWLSFAVMVGALLLAYALAQSRLGLAWRAIGDDEILGRGNGLHTTAAKLVAFTASAALAGAAGVVAGHYVGNITPDDYSLAVSATILAMVVVGGRGTLAGPAFAAAALAVLPEFLRPLHDARLIVYGVLLVVCVCVLPNGVAGLLRRRLP